MVHVILCKTGLTVFHAKFEGKECGILLDSGASSSFICSKFVEAARLSPAVLDESYTVEIADGKSIILNQDISGRLQIDRYQETRGFQGLSNAKS
jgi:predicted aspartyl protease